MSPVLAVLVGLSGGALVGYLFAAARAARAESALRERLAGLEATLVSERQASSERVRLLGEAEARLKDAFAAVSSQVLKANQDQFLQLATTKLGEFQTGAAKDLEKRQTAIDELLKPVKVSLEKMDGTLKEIDTKRATTGAGLEQLVGSLKLDQARLVSETANLVKALRAPQVRGRWGEIQLRRVVEMVGMVPYCDFEEQVSTTTETGRLRPDLIVRLPNSKTIVIDSKTPLAHYLEALEATDEPARKVHLLEHARAVREHIIALSAKDYSRQFTESPEFVVLFLPGETFFSAALENDPTLIEFGVERDVVLATPTTLIALLRAVAFGWRQEKLAEEAQGIADLGRELFERLSVMGEHFAKVGASLDKAVESYDAAVGSLEKRVLPSIRKLKDAAAPTSPKDVPELSPVGKSVTPLRADELTSTPPLLARGTEEPG